MHFLTELILNRGQEVAKVKAKVKEKVPMGVGVEPAEKVVVAAVAAAAIKRSGVELVVVPDLVSVQDLATGANRGAVVGPVEVRYVANYC